MAKFSANFTLFKVRLFLWKNKMKNLATENKKDVTVTDNGDAFISQRKTSEITGIPLSTLNRWVLENGTHDLVNENNQLSSFLFQKMVLMGQRKGVEKCFIIAEKLLEAGAKAFIYHEAGYAMQAVKSLPANYLEALTALVQSETEKQAALAQIELDKPAVAFANIVQDDSNVRCLRVWIKSMKHENNLAVGEREVFSWLIEHGYLFRESKGGVLPYSKYEANSKNYFTVSVDEINGRPRRSVKITGKGVVALTGKVVAHFKQ